jgi:PAS domain S-box-containing protein
MKNMDAARVLVVDDQIHALRGMSKIIRDAGHEPIEASNGTDCLKLAAEHKPDLIVLDLGLPDIDGREVCRQIKSDPDTTDIYVVIVSSAYIESDIQSEALEHGADGYIARPIPNREFLARVEAMLRLKYAEKRLRENEEQFRKMFQNHSSVMLLTDPETGGIVDANRAAELFYGYSASQLRSMSIQDFNALPAEEVEAQHNLDLATQRNSFIVQQRLANGEVRTVEVHSSHIEQNAANFIFSIVDDITDRKKTENRLLETEQKRAEDLLQITVHRFHTILSSLYAGVLVVTEEGRVDFANQAFCDLFDTKYPPAKLHGLSRNVILQRINQVYAEPDEAINRIRAIVAKGLPVKGEEIDIRGGRTYLRDFVPLFIDGKRYGRLWLHHDVTERKRAEEAVLKLAAIVESSDDAIISKTMDGIITSWNGGAERLYGYKTEEAIGQPISTLLPPEALDDLPDILTRISRGEVVRHFETKRLKKDGCIVDVSLSISPLKTPQGQIFGASSTARDITDRKRLEMERLETERKVLNAQKLESLSVMAEGIAHDFNNLLMVVLGNLDIALEDLPSDSAARQSIENAIQAAERSAEL